MSMTILATKLFVPPLPPDSVSRTRLLERLDGGLSRKLTLVCAPAGFGKSTLLTEWVNACQYPSAWLSLDEGDRDPVQFLAYVIAALQSISETVGAGVLPLISALPAPATESVLTALLNDLSASQSRLVLVLDDYHLASCPRIDAAVAFLITHLPPQLHLVIATRVEPELSLGRLRARGQLTELRQSDLRFGLAESTGFLNRTMHLNLSAPNIAAMDARTEGWIAGLQLAAISLQGHKDPDHFIESFTGGHQYIQDYLMEEVLRQQTEEVQSFLLNTSVLDRLSGALCDAVMLDTGGKETLAYLVQANLFIIALDNERQWYRYHHLFADLLRQRLRQLRETAIFHARACAWYEANGMEMEAFHQAVAAHDLPRAVRLIEGHGAPLYFRGEMIPVVQWLQAQAPKVLNAFPSLWVTFAWSLFIAGQPSAVGPKLLGAEAALHLAEPDATTADLRGQIAALWAWSAVSQGNVETIHTQAVLALELLHPDNRSARTAAHCALGVVHLFRGERVAARAAFADVLAHRQSNGNLMFTVAAAIALAGIQAAENDLRLAADTYRDALAMITDPAHLIGCEAHLGLARILYEWNELDEAELHALKSSTLATKKESENGLGAHALRARLMLARGDSGGVEALLAQANAADKTKRFAGRMQEIAAVEVRAMLMRGDIDGAADLARRQQLPLSVARTSWAQGHAASALTMVEDHRRTMEERGDHGETLKAMVMQSLICDELGRAAEAQQTLRQALALAEPGGFVRLFVDEGPAMARLLSRAGAPSVNADYLSKLLGVLALQRPAPDRAPTTGTSPTPAPAPELCSARELEILRLMRQGRSNQEICDQLFLSLSTVKWHNQNIFAKLQVQRRTEAVAKAIELNLVTL
jgi:LuxR family maltose regulon positive regulatory protein